MGDRTYCHLYLKEPATETVKDLLEEHLDGWSEGDGNGRWFGFEEVNYAQMPEKLIEELIALGLSWSWSWASGGGYGTGVLICDGKETREWDTNVDGDIVLSLDAVRIAERVAEAERWNVVYDATRCNEKDVAA